MSGDTMATLREYFVKDGAGNLKVDHNWQIRDPAGKLIGAVTARLHLDFEARAQYVSFYIPDIPGIELPEALVLNEIPQLLKTLVERVQVQADLGDDQTDGKDLV